MNGIWKLNLKRELHLTEIARRLTENRGFVQSGGHFNNFFGLTLACTMSEAFAMADLAGLKREILYNVMSADPLKSEMM